jgi:hypothetical protein
VSAGFWCIWCNQRVWPVFGRPVDGIWSIDPNYLEPGRLKPEEVCPASPVDQHDVLMPEPAT